MNAGMNEAVFFTIVAKNYFGYARAWAKSVRRIYPNNQIYIFTVDDIQGRIDSHKEEFPVIECKNIGIEDFDYMKFVYEVTEMATSVKPFCISYLFDKHPGQPVIYMDSDTKVFTPFDEVDAFLKAGKDVVLTPHICEPLYDGKRPDEHIFSRAGIFNLGFGVFSASPETKAFVKWWEGKLAQHCVWDLDNGIHVDQKWMDFAPAFLDGFQALRHPGYNIAYWNYAHRAVSKRSDTLVVAGQPVRFIHVSGNKLTDKNNFSVHQNRFERSEMGDFDAVLSEYQDDVIENGQLVAREWDYSFQKGQLFKNIPFYLRKDFRRKFSRFDMRGANVESFAWNYYSEILPGSSKGISRMQEAYLMARSDLQMTFDIKTLAGEEGYLQWLKNNSLDLLEIPGNR